jgi:hypothetical protein
MDKLLLVVKDRFQLRNRGLALAPHLPIGSVPHQKLGSILQTRLERPDGTTKITEAIINLEHFNPGGYKLICYIQNTALGAIPLGTKVWLIGS